MSRYTKAALGVAEDLRSVFDDIDRLGAKDQKSLARLFRDIWTHACEGEPEEVAGQDWSLQDADSINMLHLRVDENSAEHAVQLARQADCTHEWSYFNHYLDRCSKCGLTNVRQDR